MTDVIPTVTVDQMREIDRLMVEELQIERRERRRATWLAQASPAASPLPAADG